MYDIIIIGGGLAGLISSIRLSRWGYNILLLEKSIFPRHKVCGEYISNEVLGFMKEEELLPETTLPQISRLLISSPNGNTLSANLRMGGFGISRFTLDNFLYKEALKNGVNIQTQTTVESVHFDNNLFTVKTQTNQSFSAPIVIGAYGKRSLLDRKLDRQFFQQKSPFIGVKYHIKTDFPNNLIALHNFSKGYCGISQIENNTYNLCYLSHRENLKNSGSIKNMEENILYENPHLKELFTSSDFLFDKPKVINEVSFSPKSCVENHILMAGDAAGMITPLCGNGMAMAIHGSKILTECIKKHYHKTTNFDRQLLEDEYQKLWSTQFLFRLQSGKLLQNLFGNRLMTNIAIGTLKKSPQIVQWLIKQTHGQRI